MGEAVNQSVNEKKLTLKTNLSVWLVYASDVFQRHMKDELAICRNLIVQPIPLNDFIADNMSAHPKPDLVLIETGTNWAKKIVDLQNNESSLQDHEASLIVFGDDSDSHALRIALRLGATDFLSNLATIGELMPILINTSEEKISRRALGDLTLFINTKGGAGATTLALNIGVELASYQKGKVLLVDVDLQFGVVPEYLDLKPSYGIVDAMESLADLDEISIDALVTKHESGLHVLSFLAGSTSENAKHANDFARLLPLLRQFYSHVIIDLSRGIDRHMAQVIAPATRIYLVSQQNFVSLKHTNLIFHLLQYEYGQAKENIEVILNRFEKRVPIKLKDIENTLVDVPKHLVPNEYKVAVESANIGRPIVTYKRRSYIAKAVIAITQQITNPPEPRKSWFGRLFS